MPIILFDKFLKTLLEFKMYIVCDNFSLNKLIELNWIMLINVNQSLSFIVGAITFDHFASSRTYLPWSDKLHLFKSVEFSFLCFQSFIDFFLWLSMYYVIRSNHSMGIMFKLFVQNERSVVQTISFGLRPNH